MEEVIFSVNAYKGSRQVLLSLTAFDKEYSDDFGTLIYDVNSGEGEREQITFSFDKRKEGISIENGFFISHQTGCFILCGIGLAGSILDCYRKNKKSWQGFKDCLKDKGIELGTQALTCISGCFI